MPMKETILNLFKSTMAYLKLKVHYVVSGELIYLFYFFV